jgi:hypothetical protein
VRLGTCIALELAMVASAASGVWFGVGHAADLAGDYVGAREAEAATDVAPSRADHQLAIALERLPRAELSLVVPPIVSGTVFGVADETLLAPLGASQLVRVKPNKGGTSLSLRADFASGARAAFKPEQIFPQSDPRREIAAYRIDRLLGIGHVAPAKPYKVSYQELLNAADPQFRTYTQRRILEEVKAHDGFVRGMVAWWIPEIRDAKIGGVAVDEPAGFSRWASYLQIGAEIPPEERSFVEQLATVVVFDVVIDNSDRWSGANAKASPDGKTLYFMDNTLSFSRFKQGHDANLRPLRRIQVFPRGLVQKLRKLTIEQVEAALDLGADEAGMAPLLDDVELHAVMSRRNYVLEYIDELIAEFGEDRVLALP